MNKSGFYPETFFEVAEWLPGFILTRNVELLQAVDFSIKKISDIDQ